MDLKKGLALKEWAVAIEALADGNQMIVLRKGGIREEAKHFDVRGQSFWLFPTYEHQKEQLLQAPFIEKMKKLRNQGHTDPLPVSVYAEVVREWQVQDEQMIRNLEPFHIWNDSFVDLRLHWKRQQPLHVLALRVYRKKEPVMIAEPLQYAGCKSWIELPLSLPAPEELLTENWQTALGQDSFDSKMETLEQLLSTL